MPTGEHRISIQIDAGPWVWIGVGGLAVAVILAGAWLIIRTDFAPRLAGHVRRWAPLYLVLGPPAVTYIIVCGFCSAVYVSEFLDPGSYRGMRREDILASGGFRGLSVVEWACSGAGAFAFAWLVRWLRLPAFWLAVIVATMSLTAAYRTAACRPLPDGLSTGPEFLLHPTLPDAIPVLVGMGLFLVMTATRRRGSRWPGRRESA
jgi:hypothetical protein